MTAINNTTIICDFCYQEETFEGLTPGQTLRYLEPRGWRHYPDTKKHYCSRTCSANDRTIIYNDSNQITTKP